MEPISHQELEGRPIVYHVMNHAQGLAPAVSPPSRAAQQQERKDEDAEAEQRSQPAMCEHCGSQNSSSKM